MFLLSFNPSGRLFHNLGAAFRNDLPPDLDLLVSSTAGSSILNSYYDSVLFEVDHNSDIINLILVLYIYV